MSDLEDILSDKPVEEILDAVEEEPEQTEEPVEETVAEETKPEPEPEKEPEPQAVPLAALQEVRGENRELKAQLTQLQQMMTQRQQPQQPQPAPDVLENPEGYQSFISEQVQSATRNAKLDMSEEMARSQYGDEVVEAAFQAFQAVQNPGLYQSLMAAKSPWSEMVKWHKKELLAQEIGNDPEAYKASVEAKVRAELEAEFNAKAVAENVAPAPSLASQPNLGSRKAPAWTGPASAKDVYGE